MTTEEREKIRRYTDEQYNIIKVAQEQLEIIRSKCDHSETVMGNYRWRPGAVVHGKICSACDKLVGTTEPGFLEDDFEVSIASLPVIKNTEEWLSEVPKEHKLIILGSKWDWKERITLEEFQMRLADATISCERSFIDWAETWK